MTDQDQDRTSVDIATAALSMNVSIETLRKRLQRGKAPGFKAADGSWRVVLNGRARSVPAPPDNRGLLLAGALDQVAALNRKVDQLAGEVARLHERLDALHGNDATEASRAAIVRIVDDRMRPALLTLAEVLGRARRP